MEPADSLLLILIPNKQSPLVTLHLDLNLCRVWSSSLSRVCGFVSDNTQTGHPQKLLLSSNKYFGRKAFLKIAFFWVQIFMH